MYVESAGGEGYTWARVRTLKTHQTSFLSLHKIGIVTFIGNDCQTFNEKNVVEDISSIKQYNNGFVHHLIDVMIWCYTLNLSLKFLL